MIPGAIGGLALVAILALAFLLGRATTRDTREQPESGEKVLEFSAPYRGLTMVLCLLGAVIIIVSGVSDRKDATVGIACCVGMIVGMLPLMVSAFRSHLLLSEEGIVVRGGLFGGPVRLQWADIDKIQNQPGMQRFVFFGGGRRVKVSHQFVGLEALIEECKRRLQPTVYGAEFEKGINRLI